MDHNRPIILFALDRECAPFRRKFPAQQRCPQAPCRAWFCDQSTQSYLLMEIGVGPAKTQRALDWLQTQWQGTAARPPFLVMAGFAGSLTANLRIGDVFLATEIVDAVGNHWPTTWPGQKVSFSGMAGRLVTTPRLIGDATEKTRLGEKHAAQAVDMEAATVANFCQAQGVSFGCVRSISDNIDTCLSPHLVSLLGNGQVSIPRLIATLVLHPTVIGPLLKLARDTRLAAATLAEALAKLLQIGPLAA
jgi:nucleoside phosphorylase